MHSLHLMPASVHKCLRLVLAVIIVLAGLSCVIPETAYAAAYSGGGDGSAGNPFKIANAADWGTLIATVADWDKSFELTADINFGGAPLTPVGNDSDYFTGSVNGTGHKLSNATISGIDYVGVFGYLFSGSISDLGLENISVTATGTQVGGLAGFNGGSTITNCYTTGQVFASGTYAGGLIGFSSSSAITNCYATGNVSSNSPGVGGLIGYVEDANITDCYATGNVTGYINSIGGLVGDCESTTVTGSYATGDIFTPDDIAGGLIGWLTGSFVIQSYATGDVISTTGDMLGGLIGSAENVNITQSFATGVITSPSGRYLGGLLGYCTLSTLTNSYARGLVTGSDYVGSLVGASLNAATNCYGTGLVTGTTNVNGLGKFGAAPVNCYWDTDTTNQIASAGGGTGLTTAEMTYSYSPFAYIGWHFSTVWAADPEHNNDGYPYLAWQTFPEINVTGKGVTIPDGTGGPSLTSNDTFFGSVEIVSTTVTHTFTIQNSGSGNLNITAITAGGDFSISGIVLPASVAPSSNTTFDVIYDPSPASSYQAMINITSNDANENPYNFIVQGNSRYSIANTADWNALAADTDLWDEQIFLLADLDFGGGAIATVGTLAVPFTGGLVGYSHTIRNGVINGGAADNIGLFRYIDTFGQVILLNIRDISVTTTGMYVGGIAGYSKGNVVLCAADNVTVSGFSNVGGLVGYADDGEIGYSYSTGTITASSESAGGLAGFTLGTPDIHESYSSCTVNGGNNAGGLIGHNQTDVINCYATGRINGDWYVGGLVGYDDHGSITNCYATGNVTGNVNVTGLAFLNGPITVTDSYWNTETSGIPAGGGGTGLTTDNMTSLPYNTSLVYEHWDFTAEWVPDFDSRNMGYPFLWWQDFNQEMDIDDGLNIIPDGTGSFSFGNCNAGQSVTADLFITNAGDTANLTIGSITFSGPDAGLFSITAAPAASLAPGDFSAFTIRFAPTSTGVKTAVISIVNDDANENPYDITLTGTGTSAGGGGGGGGAVIPVPGTTNLNGFLLANGSFIARIYILSQDTKAMLTINQGDIGLDKDGRPLIKITILPVTSPPPPASNNIIGLAYDFTPNGATFIPGITITLNYDPALLPDGVKEEDLVIAYYDQSANPPVWVKLVSTVNKEKHTVTAFITHFTVYAIAVPVLPPTTTAAPEPTVTPTVPQTTLPAPTTTVTAPAKTTVPKPALTTEPQPPATTGATQPPTVPPPAASSPWPVIGGIAGGVIVLAIILAIVIRTRRD